MHITAYFTNTFVHLGMFCLQQHYGTLLLVLQQLYLVYPERSHNLQKHSQNNPDVSGGNHNAKINFMNLIVHGNLVHIEGGDNAKHIENQMCTTTFPRVLIVRGFLAWAMKGDIFAKFNHRPSAAITKTFWDFKTGSRFFYYPSPFFCCFQFSIDICRHSCLHNNNDKHLIPGQTACS